MAADWYCWIEGTEHGPVTSDQLRTMARNGNLSPTDQVRKGEAAAWYPASRIKGLFADPGTPAPPAPFDPGLVRTETEPRRGTGLPTVRSIADCISLEERRKRAGVALVNGLIWLVLGLLTVVSWGGFLLVSGVIWLLNRLLAEYNVRRLQAYGTAATENQFPEVVRALAEVRAQFGVQDDPRVIILNDGSINAFAIKFARRKVIVLLSGTLEGVLEEPAQLRFILAHELAHVVLDHGWRGVFERYKPAAYQAARELTCDTCGCAAAGDLDASREALKRLGVGNQLHRRLSDDALIAEARYIESGLTGWLLRQYLTYPPLGRRIANVIRFHNEHQPKKDAPGPRWDQPNGVLQEIA